MSKLETVQDRFGAFSGLIFVLIYFASIILNNPLGGSIDVNPDTTSSTFPTVLIRNSSDVEKGLYIALISIFFLFAFIAYLRRQLQFIDRPGGWLPSMAFAAGIVICGVFLLEINNVYATTLISDYGDDWQVARTLAIFVWANGEVQGPAFAALVAATGFVFIRMSSIWTVTGWLSIAISLVMLLYTPGTGLALFLVWVSLISILLAFGIRVTDLPDDSMGRVVERLGIRVDRD